MGRSREKSWSRGLAAAVGPLLLAGLVTAGALVAGGALAQSPGTGASRGNGSSPEDGGLNLAYRYITVGWIDWAALHLADVVDALPRSEALALLGMVYQSLGDVEEALDAYLRSVEASASDRERSAALTLAANVLVETGRFEEARERFAHALELVPHNAQAMHGLGRIAEARGMPADAIEWYQQAAQASPEWIDPVIRAALLYNEKGEFGAAAALLRRAESLGTWNAEFHYQLALSYEGLMVAAAQGSLGAEALEALGGEIGEPGEAATRLRELAVHAADRVLQLAPEHTGAAELIARLSPAP